METKEIIIKYGYYYNHIQILGQIELKRIPSLEELKLSRGVVQAGYKEMKEAEFSGTLVHYLCYISTLYLLDIAKKNTKTPIEAAMNIINNYPLYMSETICLLRLFNENPEILIDNLMPKYRNNYTSADGTPVYNDAEDVDMYKVFVILSSAWYEVFRSGVMCNEEPREFIFDVGFGNELKMLNLIKQLIDS